MTLVRGLSLVLLLLASPSAAKVINVEFKFTPFVGDPAKADHVATVAGEAKVLLNGVPIAAQPVRREDVPVLFDEREIAPAVWVPADSLGSMLRKGKNTIRIEFTPTDAQASYRAQLRWAAVNDAATQQGGAGRGKATNQSDEGVDDKTAKGKVVFEREFVADFAADRPWHHYPPVDKLGDADQQQLGALVNGRAAAFKPDFADLYALLKKNDKIDVAAVQQAKCLEQAYAAGIRIVPAPTDQVEVLITGGPAVVIAAKGGNLYVPEDPSAFEKITDERAQMCVGAALFAVYPPRLVAVKAPSGTWELVD